MAAGSDTAPLLRRVGGLLAPYRPSLVLVAVTIAVGAGLGIVTPFLTQAVFDRALFPAGGGGVDLRLLLWLVAGMVVVPLLTAGIGVGQTYLTTTVGNRAMAELRSRLFEHLERMELAFFTATKTGSIQSRLVNDVGGVRSVLTNTAASILSNAVTVIASLVAMLLLSWQLTVISLALMPVFLVLQRRVGARRQVLARRTQESLSDMTAITEEALSVSGVLLSKVFNRADVEIARYRQENERQVGLQVRQAMAGQGFFGVVSAFMAITPALVYLASGIMLDGGAAISAGTLVAFSTLQARLLMPMVSLMRVTMDVQTSLALFRRIFEYLDLVPAITDRPDPVRLDVRTVRGDVELVDVWFSYPPPPRLVAPAPSPAERPMRGLGGTRGAMLGYGVAPGTQLGGGHGGSVRSDPRDTATPPADAGSDPLPRERIWAVQGVSLTVRAGQLAAFVGPSGAGKTTLTYLVPRLYEVDRGAVRVDGHDVRDLALGSLAETVGMVTQDPYLFHASIGENLRYARPDATDAELADAARTANIHDRIMAFPDGYATTVGERGYRLSGGEKQRLAIARVVLKDPRILILDEATSALDTASERLVQQALATVMAGRTTIAIAHRLSTIRHADVIFVVDDGRVVERGTHGELLASGGLYARLHAEQFGGGRIEARFADGVMFTDGVVLAQPRRREPEL